MMREVLRRPSIAVAAWGVALLSLFAWRGDLRLDPGQRSRAPSAATQQQPVVVRRSSPSKPVAEARATRAGRVLDTMGFLLVGADVVPDGGSATRTGADGSFSIELARARASDLLVRAEGRRSRWLRTSAVGPDGLLVCLEPAAPWDAAPEPLPALPTLRGEGLVRAADGRPLPFAWVRVQGTDCWGRADDIGRVELPLPAAAATFVVHRPGEGVDDAGFAAVSEPFVASRTRGVVPLPDLIAVAAGSIRGIVRDARGAAVAGAPVAVRSAAGVRHVETGVGGAFVLAGLPAADYVVEPLPHRGSVGEAVPVRVDRAAVACDLQLRRLDEAGLRVVDEAGAVAAGVWVAASLHGLRRGVAQADGEGLVALPFAAESEFEVRRPSGHESGSFAHCAVRRFDADAEPAMLVIAQP